jgi:hypothetical protein
VNPSPEEWAAIRETLKQVYVGSREPPMPRWQADSSDGTWKHRMAALMNKRIAARRRKNWEALKRRWVEANYERLKSGKVL